ncbi:MAG TPA: hypothetical protein VHM70_27760 [Polyangiaceae bacterium]|nr:hypothetical protein [Polyangiaceae bacterium]
MKKSMLVNSLVASATLLGACSGAEFAESDEAAGVESDVGIAQQGQALSVSPPVSQFVVLARQAASFNERSLVRGANLGVGPGAGGTQNTLNAAADSSIGLGFDTLAQRVVLGNRTTAGNLDLTTYLPGVGVTTGARTAYVAPVAAPNPTAATVGTQDVMVNANSTLPLAPGRYNNITVNGILNLNGGLYEARTLTLNNDARVVAQSRSVVRLLTGVSALDRTRIGTAAGLSASDLTLEANGGLVSNPALGVSLANDAQLNALVIASRGFRAGDRLSATGAVAAQTVTTGFSTSLSFQGGFGCSSDAECGGGGSCSGQCIDAQCVLPSSCSAVQISPGSDHACATLADGTASCWGDNGQGDLGQGHWDSKVGPSPVVTDAVGTKLGNVRSVDVGGQKSCAVLNDGNVWCWGFVPGLPMPSPIAVPVSGFSSVSSISLGLFGTYAVLSNGTVSCQDNTGSIAPTGVTGATSVAVGDSFACALVSGGAVRCWGTDNAGQLGDGVSGSSVAAPGVLVPGVTNAVSITATLSFACAVLSSGQVKCWGSNSSGQIGVGTMSDTLYTPTVVSGLTDAVQIGAGINHVCAVRRTGAIQCWGANFNGQLGSGDTNPLFAPSTPVVGLTNATQVGGATNFSCAVTRDGRAFCWGADNDANLGDGDGQLPDKVSAVQVQF